jgi:hypothetical protein
MKNKWKKPVNGNSSNEKYSAYLCHVCDAYPRCFA